MKKTRGRSTSFYKRNVLQVTSVSTAKNKNKQFVIRDRDLISTWHIFVYLTIYPLVAYCIVSIKRRAPNKRRVQINVGSTRPNFK